MMPLLVFRERVKNFYQRYDIYLTPVVKFLFAIIIFQTINKEIGYDEKLKALPVVLILSLLSAFTPSVIVVLLAAIVSALHVYSISPILSIIIIMILLILYLMLARYTPRLGYVMLAVPILYFLKLPFIIPILLGLISGPIAIIPIGCGVIIYNLFEIIKIAVSKQINMTVEDILAIYKDVIDSLIHNKQMLMSIVIFALILLVTYFVRKMKFDYAFEISIVAGAITGILGFLISNLILDKSDQILIMIFGAIASAVIVYIIHFFKLTLDYSGVEHAQFEDDVYYYYVKAVPKITVTTPKMDIKHISVKHTDQGSTGRFANKADDNYDDDEDEADDTDRVDYNRYSKSLSTDTTSQRLSKPIDNRDTDRENE